MMGFEKETTSNNLKFHKETKLLIAVADESLLWVVDDVLRALEDDVPYIGRASSQSANTQTNKLATPLNKR